MDARRRARPGVTLMLLAARVGGGGRHQALALVRRERLVLGPGLAQALVRRRPRRLGELLVVLARRAPLLGREARPGLHPALPAGRLLPPPARTGLVVAQPILPAIG